MKIERMELRQNLLQFAREGNGIVVGKPGSGKTHSLLQLVDSLRAENIPHLTLLVDRLGQVTNGEIEAALDIKGSLVEKLKTEYFDTSKPAVVVIDGFDAARNTDAQKNLIVLLKDLISQLKGGWNVVVSVRSFDAKKSKDLLNLFPQESTSHDDIYVDTAIKCRHFSIPLLTKDEILSTENDIPGLRRLYESGSTELKLILSTPFNLWLLSRLDLANDKVDFNLISSEVQLLQIFWSEYISSSSNSEIKEQLLGSLTKKMVASYSLSVRKDDFFKADLEEAWKRLFSDEILTYTSFTNQTFAFSHNILFDYAVSVLLLSDKPDDLMSFLSSDPARTLFLRPSLTYHFTAAWYHDRKIFWELFWTILDSSDANLRLFARLVPAAVAVMQIAESDDFKILLNPPKQYAKSANDSIVRLFQAYDTFRSNKDSAWISFLHQLSTNPKNEYIWYIAKITDQIIDHANLSKDQNLILQCGSIARNLLSYILKERKNPTGRWLDGVGADFVLPLVTKTFSTEARESRKLIIEVLDMIKEENFIIKYIYRLSDSIAEIWPSDAELVEEIYKKIFGYEEKSTENTSFGSPVLPLISNRKQDFEMCYYHLSRLFPDFLKDKPINAAKAAIDSLNTYILRDHVAPYTAEKTTLNDLTSQFTFRGLVTTLIQDNSCIWDSNSGYRNDDEMKIAQSLFNYIENIEDDKLINDILGLFANNAVCAFWWRRLLRLGTANKNIANKLFDVASATPVLACFDTQYDAIEFIHAQWANLSSSQRTTIQSIVATLQPTSSFSSDRIQHFKETLLAKIPINSISNEHLSSIKSSLIKEQRNPTNRRPYEISTHWGPIDDEDNKAETDPKLKQLKTAESSLSEFSSKFLNAVPNFDDVKNVMAAIRLLFSYLHPTPIATDTSALTQAWTTLGSAAEAVAKSNLEFATADYLFIRDILILCSEHEKPTPAEDAEERFTSPSYSPLPRHEAAQGLPWLARLGVDTLILNALTKLGSDMSPAVRYLVAFDIWRLHKASPDFMWNFLSDRSQNEKNPVVLSALSYSVGKVVFINEPLATPIIKNLFNKLVKENEEKESARAILGLTVYLHLFKSNPWAESIFKEIINSPFQFPSILRAVTHDLLGYCIVKFQKENKPVFEKAIQTINDLITPFWKEISKIHKSIDGKWTKENNDQIQVYYSPIDEIITRIYFAADVDPELRRAKTPRALTNDQREKYYLAIKPLLLKILNEASSSGGGMLFAPTAHHFMELLVGVLDHDVSGALKMAADLVCVSEAGGYNLDSMAIKEVVFLTERVLSDYRHELRKPENIENLVRLLDIFARIGWTDALKLVWRLDEIYR